MKLTCFASCATFIADNRTFCVRAKSYVTKRSSHNECGVLIKFESDPAIETSVTTVSDITELVKPQLVYSSVRQHLRSDRLAHARRVGRDGCQARSFSPRGIHYCNRYPAKIINELMRGGERERGRENTQRFCAEILF